MVRQLPEAVADAVRDDVRQLLKTRPDIALNDLVHCTSLSESTGRNFMSGHCQGGHEVVSELRDVVMKVKAGDVLLPGGGDRAVVVAETNGTVRRVKRSQKFYQTQTVERVADVLDYCAEKAEIGIITADFGVGKTEAVGSWRRGRGRKVESLVFEFDEFSSSNKIDFVHCLAQKLGVPYALGTQNAPLGFRAICEHLARHPCLLIFDQCETVRPRVFQIIRQIWDKANAGGTGVVILAAPVLLTRLNKSGMADLGALTSRVGIWAPLAGVTRGEMTAIIKQEGVKEVDDSGFDLWWKATGGSMRRLMKSIELVREKHGERRVTEKTVAGVAGHLWGMAVEI